MGSGYTPSSQQFVCLSLFIGFTVCLGAGTEELGKSSVEVFDANKDLWKDPKLETPMYHVPKLTVNTKNKSLDYFHCRNIGNPVIIKVKDAVDINKRVKYSPETTVLLKLTRNIYIFDTLILAKNFSCTIFTSDDSGGKYGYQIRHNTDKKAGVLIMDTSNILMYRVGWKINVGLHAPRCKNVPLYGPEMFCPAISIFRSYAITISLANVQGRIDLAKAALCRLDSLVVRSVGNRLENPGVISIGESGIGPDFIKGDNWVINCDIAGLNAKAHVGINLFYGAIGNQIRNNYVHDFQYFGLSGGFGGLTAGNCLLNEFSNNNVYNSRDILKRGLLADSAGIYFNLHWLGFGNVLNCNYVTGPGHCYYLDYATSGLHVNGGACIDTDDGIKINNGKENKLKDILMVRTKNNGIFNFLNCVNYAVNNCKTQSGSYWEKIRKQFFNSKKINNKFPWMQHICKDTSFDGLSCNPKGAPQASVTAKCSGIPTGNFVQWVNIGILQNINFSVLCTNPYIFNLTEKFNTVGSFPTPKNYKSGLFNNYGKGDFGVPASSALNAKGYKFTSCPKASIGPQKKTVTMKSLLNTVTATAPHWWRRSLRYKLVSA